MDLSREYVNPSNAFPIVKEAHAVRKEKNRLSKMYIDPIVYLVTKPVHLKFLCIPSFWKAFIQLSDSGPNFVGAIYELKHSFVQNTQRSCQIGSLTIYRMKFHFLHIHLSLVVYGKW